MEKPEDGKKEKQALEKAPVVPEDGKKVPKAGKKEEQALKQCGARAKAHHVDFKEVESVVVPEQGKKEGQALEKDPSNVVPEPKEVTLKPAPYRWL